MSERISSEYRGGGVTADMEQLHVSGGSGGMASGVTSHSYSNSGVASGLSVQGAGDEDDEEMSTTERELAEDAAWKRIQQNTFTRWANEHLKAVGKQISNLECDFSDGLRLISLIEVLSGKKMPRHNRKPSFRSQKLENVSVALQFLERDENIRIVNIDSTDIVDCKLKLILGLIWTLILHYSISLPMWEGESAPSADKQPTPKQRLLHWIQGHVGSPLPISNFTNDWNDGRAVGALVDSVAPGLCSDWPDWTPNEALKNTTQAMTLADDWLGVPQLITPEEMINPNCDELSMMTYLSQFPNAKIKPGAPLKPRAQPQQVKVFGPGVEPEGVVAGVLTHFTVDSHKAGKGKVEACLVDPEGQQIQLEVVPSSERPQVFTARYTARVEGVHKVIVKFSGRATPASPYTVGVAAPLGDPALVTASGPGLLPDGVVISKTTYFDICAKGAGRGDPEVIILDANGSKTTSKVTMRPRLAGDLIDTDQQQQYNNSKDLNFRRGSGLANNRSASNGTAANGSSNGSNGSAVGRNGYDAPDGDYSEVTRVEYTATTLGLHSVNVFFAGKPIPGSPFGVKVAPASNARRVRASGRGLQPTGVRVGDDADFKVVTKGAGEGDLLVKVIGPGGVSVPVEEEEIDNYTSKFVYRPRKEGKHVVMVSYAGVEVPRSPFQVGVGPTKQSRIKAFGPGLHGGVAGQPATFTVEANGETGALGFSIEGPSEAKIECKDLGDGSADVTYLPTCEGEYALHVLCQGEDIPDSPYIADILPSHSGLTLGDLSKVTCSGPGVSKSGVTVLEETYFLVKGASNPDDIAVQIIDGDYRALPVAKSSTPSGGGPKQYKFAYTPQTAGKHTVMVTYGGLSLADSPYRVGVAEACDPRAVVVKGPGIESGVKSNTPTHFDIDCRSAGPGDVQIALSNEAGQDVPINIRDNGDGTFRVDYETRSVGRHKVVVLYAGQEVPQSPLLVPVQPSVDVSKVKVDGLEPSVFVDCPTSFVVDTRSVGGASRDSTTRYGSSSRGPRGSVSSPDGDGRDQGKLLCLITSPSGGTTDSLVESQPDHTYKISYTPFEEGCHTIDLIYSGAPIPGSPFTVNVRRGSDASKCRAWGPGLAKGKTSQPNSFTVETKGAGSGGLGLAIEGPSEAELVCRDNRDGSCTVEYNTNTPGDYDIAVRFADRHIPGSPFKVPVEGGEASKVQCYGPGLEPGKVRAGAPLHFTVDASKAETPGPGQKSPLKVNISNENGPLSSPPVVREVRGGVYDVCYTPEQGGAEQTTEVTWDGEPVPGSPWTQHVSPKYGSGSSSPVYENFTQQQKQPQQESGVPSPGVRVAGPGVSSPGVPASLPTAITIDAADAPDRGAGDVDVSVVGPDGHPRKTQLEMTGPGQYQATFLPDDCGKYRVAVHYNDEELPNSPFPVQVFATGKADKCEITEGISHALNTGEEYCIAVDAKNAGHGAVTCRIRSTSGSDLDIDITDNGDGTFSIYYTVEDAGDYTLAVKFGGQPVPQGFYTFTAQESSESYPAPGTKGAPRTTNRPTRSNSSSKTFPSLDLSQIPLPSTGGHVTATVVMPSGELVSPVITDNRDGTVKVQYEPSCEGLHELTVLYNGENVQGSPYKFYVDSLESGTVTAHGSGLVHGITGEPSTFTISSKNAGAGSLSLAVEGPSKAEISCHDNKDGTVTASYLPTSPGDYKVSVKFADKHIRGSPYTARVTGEGRKRSQISVGSQSEVKFPGSVPDSEITTLNAAIMAPSGLEEPCFIKKLPDGKIGISFTPREKGQHWVSLRKKGSDISGSPFKIEVSNLEVGDAARVMVSGPGIKEGKTQQENTFTVDTRHAGFGGLSLSIEGPSKADISCKDNEDGTLAISYKPTEPGYYIINLKFADNLVDQSPYTVKVTGEGSNRQTERIHRQRDAAPLTEVGSQCRLTFKLPGISPYDLSALVTSPKGESEAAETLELEEGLFGVNFVPKELGVHTVSVKYMDAHIPGSPFQFTVGPLKDGGAHRVHAGGPGLERGEVFQPCEFNVWTREAGAGALAISVEGPSKAVIDFKDRKDGSCYASYEVHEPGEYRVGIKFNEKHIPDSPFKVFVTPELGEARKVEVAQFPDQGAKANKAQNCLIIMNGAKGEIDCKLVTPNGKEDDVFMDKLDEEVHAVRFVPRVNGVHYFHVKCKGIQIPGSPFRLRVGEEEADPAACSASGNGLKEIATGTKADFIVDTCSAGAGTLAVTIDGPSKVAMDCTEVDNGYKVRYTPLVNGDYYVHIKYNNVHISGSPWKVKCTGMGKADKALGVQESSQVVVETVEKVSTKTTEDAGGPVLPKFNSDASKVSSKGLGLKKAHPGRQNNFTINASQAGNNILYVGVYGPKGPCEEVSIKHMGHYNYTVGYKVKERGDFVIVVRYGDQQIPGSPFFITT